MRKLFFSFLIFVSGFAYASKNAEYIPGEVLVKFKKGLSTSSKNSKILSIANSKISDLTDAVSLVKLNSNQSVESAITNFKNDSNVEYAEPNYIRKISTTTPNDTYYGQLWGLKNTGQTITSPSYSTNNPGTSGLDMDLEHAWDYITDCSSKIVAVIDTGVNYNQEDLANSMWTDSTYTNHGYDFVDSDNNPIDTHGHGTHVAGTIAAQGNNGAGTAGVCWKSKIMAIRVLNTLGSGSTSNLINGINFAVAHGANIINMSLDGSGFSQAESDAIDAAKAAGVLLIVAAGNSGEDTNTYSHYPCNYSQDNILCVAALDQSYNLASFSDYGTTHVDVGAPGVNIKSSWPGTNTVTNETFNTGGTLNWTTAGGANWAYHTRSSVDFLELPTNFNGTNQYGNNLDERAYKTFTMPAQTDACKLSFYAYYDTETTNDYVQLKYKGTAGDPYTGGSLLATFTGSSGSTYLSAATTLNSCTGSSISCSLGFRFVSNGSVTASGFSVALLSVDALTWNTNSYNILNGTSMATPHVVGLANLIWAYNTNYTYSDVVESIKSGGVDATALSGKTTTGKAVNAFGSLKYIQKITGVSATAQ